jgi:hypothetical protein
MAVTTITEAPAEIKTIDKRIEKKREFITTYLVRNEQLKDPLDRDGGSFEAIRRERQAIKDLEELKVAIRRAILDANQENTITLSGTTRSIADWLVWRREVAPTQERFLTTLRRNIDANRAEAQKRGLAVAEPDKAKERDLIVNLNEAELAEDIEQFQEALGSLDGQLSLKNATVTIEY